MKKLSLSLLAMAAAIGFAQAQTAYTTPVGYYEFDATASGNFFVPGFVNSAAFAGVITADSSTTLTVATNAITANAFNAAGGEATHYVEITQAGANQGVVIDIVSNTNAIITLASDITALGLAGTETIVVRPHVTVGSVFAGSEAVLSAFSDSVTALNPDGSSTAYLFTGGGVWSTDFGTTNDGGPRPIAPGTGIIFETAAEVTLTVVGEVKSSPVVVQAFGNGVPNIVGPVNPLVGDAEQLVDLGFANMSPFSDTLTLYAPGPIITPSGVFLADGGGNVIDDGFNISTATLPVTRGGIFQTAADSSIRINSGL